MNKLRTLYGVFLLGLLVAPTSVAQQWSGGLKVGGALTTFTGNSDANFSARSGLAGGVALGYDFGMGLSVMPEILYITKGAETSQDLVTDSGVLVQQDFRWSISYAELALLVSYRFQGGGYWQPRVFAGPMTAFKLDATIRSTTSSLTQTSTDDSIESRDHGLVAGVAIDSEFGGQRLSFEIRGTFGLANVRDVKPELHNTGAVVLIALLF